MHHPKRIYCSKDLEITFFRNLGKYIKNIQHESGAIPSNEDGSHDPWDHIESIMGLNFSNEYEASKRAFNWLIRNQNIDGSWYAKYKNDTPIEKNKPTHFGPYISVAALHFYKISKDKDFLEKVWPTIELAINFSVNLQTKNGTIPWSIDKHEEIEHDFLITGSSSILKRPYSFGNPLVLITFTVVSVIVISLVSFVSPTTTSGVKLSNFMY